MKVLNLYAGIGGNRKLWKDVEVTAVEINSEIAKVYQELFPQDKVIVGDAHQFLLEHYEEFDFIWSSPPCTSHSSFAKLIGLSNDFKTGNYNKEVVYPDLKLYEEILLLKHYFKGKFVIENVIPYYEPLIEGKKIQRHLFWINFPLTSIKIKEDNIKWGKVKEWEKNLGYDLSKYKGLDKRKVLRNCVNPELALHIFEMAFKKQQTTLSITREVST